MVSFDSSLNKRPRSDVIRSSAEQATLVASIDKGVSFLVRMQGADGSWRGDYAGPMFLLPIFVAASYACKRPISPDRSERMIAYLFSAQNSDGGIGLHAEAREGTVFTSVLCYVALRILGVDPQDCRALALRQWILDHGTALAAAGWAKWILALLNLYDYCGLLPVLPELFLLPSWLPFHPSRFWCHTRQVYLPAAILYATRARIGEDPLILELRNEIYDQPYDSIPFPRHRHTLAACDRLIPVSRLFAGASWLSQIYEAMHLTSLRRRALAKVLDHVQYEDRVTNYVRLGPVNAALNTLVLHFRGGDREVLDRSWQGLSQYLEESHDYLKLNGYLSSALWDTAFAVQAISSSPMASQFEDSLQRAYGFIRDNQVTEDLPDYQRYYRDRCRGGWGFGGAINGWPVSDCTAEALRIAIDLANLVDQPVANDLLRDSIQFILRYQNRDGGWATYEHRRGGDWLERLNPSAVFRDIMVDYSYVECTTACIQALVAARQRFPDQFDRDIDRAIRRGRRFIEGKQRSDGSWEGSWGICFTYGTWFGINGLMAAGVSANASRIDRAISFLKRNQQSDGGWGEDYQSCLRREYVARESLAVNTSWALLALVNAGHGRSDAASRAAQFLINRQSPDGDWPREAMTGVFNKTVVINYENHRRYFCVWALSEFYRAKEWKDGHAR